MAERVLTLRELNRATLARQFLLERVPLTPAQVIEHLVGIQAQWPSAPYTGIWTRTTSFRQEELEQDLACGTVVKATMMRQTLHLVTRRDYGLIRAALAETNHLDKSPDAQRFAPLMRTLAATGHLTTAEALSYLEREYGLTGIRARRAWRGARVRAHLLPHHESALWRAGPESRYVPLTEPEPHEPAQARAEMLRRYLAAFGPATLRDMTLWAMMHVPETRRAVALMEPLVRYRDEHGRELLDLAGAALPDPETPAPVRFLPKWDNVLLAFTDRTRVLPEPYRKKVIKINGDVAQTFFVDGFVAGIWRNDGGRVLIEPFTALPRKVLREVEAEAGLLERFLATPSERFHDQGDFSSPHSSNSP